MNKYEIQRYGLLVDEGVEFVHRRAVSGGDIFHAIDSFVNIKWNDPSTRLTFAKDIEDIYFQRYGYLADEEEFAKGRDEDANDNGSITKWLHSIQQFWGIIPSDNRYDPYSSDIIPGWADDEF